MVRGEGDGEGERERKSEVQDKVTNVFKCIYLNAHSGWRKRLMQTAIIRMCCFAYTNNYNWSGCSMLQIKKATFYVKFTLKDSDMPLQTILGF